MSLTTHPREARHGHALGLSRSVRPSVGIAHPHAEGAKPILPYWANAESPMSSAQGKAADANASEEGASSSEAGPAIGEEPKPEAWDWKAQALAFAVFASGNIGLNYFNSWALKKTNPDGSLASPGFVFPVFYTMWHMLVGSIASLVLLCTFTPPKEGGMPSFGQLWQYADALIPIAICTTLNVALNNVSLTIVSLFVNQVAPHVAHPDPVSIAACSLSERTRLMWHLVARR